MSTIAKTSSDPKKELADVQGNFDECYICAGPIHNLNDGIVNLSHRGEKYALYVHRWCRYKYLGEKNEINIGRASSIGVQPPKGNGDEAEQDGRDY